MHNIQILLTCAYSIPIILHGIGFYLLYNTKYNLTFGKVQRFLLLNLNFIEVGVCILPLAYINARIPLKHKNYLDYIQIVGVTTMFYFVYFIITLDRLLMVYLNIRYNIVVTVKRIRWVFCAGYGMTGLVVLIISIQEPKEDLKRIFLSYLNLPLCICFILFAASTYLYTAFSNRRRKTKFLKQQQMKTDRTKRFNRLPYLLISSFLLFFIVPTLMFACLMIRGEFYSMSQWVQVWSQLSYATTLSMDALLYIFSIKKIRAKFQCCKSPFTSPELEKIAVVKYKSR